MKATTPNTGNNVVTMNGARIAWNAKQDGETFGRAMVETEAAIYQALESFAVRCIAEFRDRDHQEQAMQNFLDGFAESYCAARVRAYQYVASNGNKTSLTADQRTVINTKAKSVTKVTKSQIKAVLSKRLFDGGKPVNCNIKDYLAKEKPEGKKPVKPDNTGNESGVISTKALCKSIDGFMTLLNAVINGGINSDNPEVIAKAESIKAFINGAESEAKKPARKAKPKTLGAALVDVAA